MTFTVLGPPSTKGSTRSFVRGGRVVTLADAQTLGAWTQAVKWAATTAKVPLAPKPSPVEVLVCFVLLRPASAKKRTHPTVKPDIDKTLRAVLDALTGIAYDDDAQVVRVRAEKVYGESFQTDITVRVA